MRSGAEFLLFKSFALIFIKLCLRESEDGDSSSSESDGDSDSVYFDALDDNDQIREERRKAVPLREKLENIQGLVIDKPSRKNFKKNMEGKQTALFQGASSMSLFRSHCCV